MIQDNTNDTINTRDTRQGHLYLKVAATCKEWLETHQDEWFNFYDIVNFHNWNGAEAIEHRKALSKWLYYESGKAEPQLEKKNKSYRYIYRGGEGDVLDWVNADENEVLDIRWPYGIDDNSTFGFEEYLAIPPGSLIIVAGTSNKGKTAWCLNFLAENMDKHPCIYMSNEFTSVALRRRLIWFDWVEFLNGDNTPKFKAIRRYRNWEDVVRTNPDGINIIDYLRLEDNTQVGNAIKVIQEKLNKGLAVLALQKPPGRDEGYGGYPTIEAASLYLAIDKNKLKVVKAKDHTGKILDDTVYSFDIVHHGAKFHNIQEVT